MKRQPVLRDAMPMLADFLANDFSAIARAMRQEPAPPKVLLRFWHLIRLRETEHDSVEAAVAEAYERCMDRTTAPDHIAAADGTVLLDHRALVEHLVASVACLGGFG